MIILVLRVTSAFTSRAILFFEVYRGKKTQRKKGVRAFDHYTIFFSLPQTKYKVLVRNIAKTHCQGSHPSLSFTCMWVCTQSNWLQRHRSLKWSPPSTEKAKAFSSCESTCMCHNVLVFLKKKLMSTRKTIILLLSVHGPFIFKRLAMLAYMQTCMHAHACNIIYIIIIILMHARIPTNILRSIRAFHPWCTYHARTHTHTHAHTCTHARTYARTHTRTHIHTHTHTHTTHTHTTHTHMHSTTFQNMNCQY